ncbi:probable serine/threonine-protein kinase DDB_G0267686 [Panonychus citri]|uniref:probable serine/threonine-protein kinase DDB_G0267686 n=1 Tax=Panonychus citri TaxID=50023 RepID=UPI002306FA33|nr:probable serine/threonine-protein kinase DDB_G0267686 [Panonychus citri]
MLTGLANYLFGLNEFTDEVLENLFKETPIKGADGDDWILVELRQQQQLDSNGSHEQSIGCPGDIEPGSGGLTSTNDDEQLDQQRASNEISLINDEDKQSTNKENVSEDDKQSTANNNYPTENDEVSSEEDDDEEEEDDEDDRDGEAIDELIANNNDAKNQETAIKRKKRKSRENNNPTGTMEGSWFMTPPPCFVSHKKSIKKISVSPLEDILIEHPSISVFHSHTSSSLDSFYPLPSQSSLAPTPNTIGSPSSSQHSPCPTLHLLPSPGIRFADLTSLATVAVSSIVALATPSSSNRSNRSNRGQRNGSSSNNRNNNNNNRLNDEAIQPPRAGETRGANLENHERTGHLSEITNHHLAPMQKAMNQGSQKYLKKSFLNRQNLVKIQSNQRPTRRHRCTQRPSGYSNNRKMC